MAPRPIHRFVSAAALLLVAAGLPVQAGPARLLRQPTLSASHIAFAHAGDLWIVDRAGGDARRLTSTPAVEEDPHLSPDGTRLAFTSNRSGIEAVYVVPVAGGDPTRLTWYPAGSFARGWTPDGSSILYASERETAPVGFERLWTVSPDGGPSLRLPAPWGRDGSFAADGARLVVDRVSRWDSEWRNYRGGQNTALTILDLDGLEEIRLPNERTTDIQPLWMDGTIYFLSDRDWTMNVWAYDVAGGALTQVTRFRDIDVKWLAGHAGALVIERDGWLHAVDASSGRATPIEIHVSGDFPWATPRWEDVGEAAGAASLSATGKRALFEARGEIFTVPVEKGDPRNLTRSSGAADRAPVWSPDGREIAWFSDRGEGYEILIAGQDGLSEPRRVSIDESRMAWDPAWSPDGTRLAFVDDDLRVRVVEIGPGAVTTVDRGGVNIERGSMGLTWSPDSRWLAYAKTFPNNLRRIVVWSLESGVALPLTGPMADAGSPAWDPDGRHLYFLASTDLALGSGWANTSAMQADPTYGVYAAVLRADDPTPFIPESDEEPADAEDDDLAADDADGKGKKEDRAAGKAAGAAGARKKSENKTGKKDKPAAADEEDADEEDADDEDADDAGKVEVRIDFDGIERRTIPLPMPVARYALTAAGPEGTVFVAESQEGEGGMTLHKFSREKREASVFVEGISSVAVSSDHEKLLLRSGSAWRVVGTGEPPQPGDGALDLSLRMRLDRAAEWRQMFDEAWHYQRDFFYDPDLHGRDWNAVRARYEPLVPHVRHRTDLNYILDQMNGELSVGHSFVFGGDMPDVDTSRGGLLGADLTADAGRWRIDRIYTFESWNPEVAAPLDRPGLRVEQGHYLVAVDGVELTAVDDPYRLLDGTADRQTTLHVNDRPSMEGAWTETVRPIASESGLRQRAWVEDNRRRVDALSGGKLAYVWVPNTGGPGVVSFNRYFFAQQDRLGAVIDERFNGGGLLDDYMVDLMTRRLRAAITNEVEGAPPFRLPAGILGPKVLLINELAGSGGDFFPWVFRQQQVGPLIGARTWGGLVKSSVHYLLVDGGGLTAPDNAVFDPIGGTWIAENQGVAPDIEVLLDARSVAAGRDPQLERAVQETLRLLDEQGAPAAVPPPFPTPARPPGGGD